MRYRQSRLKVKGNRAAGKVCQNLDTLESILLV